MAKEVRLAPFSDEMTEGTISRWLKREGDAVESGEPIVEVETEKVIVEVESPQAGVIVRIVAQEQELVPVGGVLCLIGTAAELGAAGEASDSGDRSRKSKPAKSKPLPPPESSQPSLLAGAASPARAVSNVVPMQAPGAPSTAPASRETGATPLARRVAASLGIDLSGLGGTGPGGKVVMADLQPYLQPAQQVDDPAPPLAPFPRPATGASQAVPSSTPANTEQGPFVSLEDAEIPHSTLRRTIARRMSEAKREIPHFYMSAEVDVTEALRLRERLNQALQTSPSGARITVNDLMLKATALALESAPDLNATYDETALRRHGAAHLGFATDIGAGLVTPVVRDCQLKSIGRIAREAAALIERAKARKLTPEEMQGGTFTLSNLGMYPVLAFSAIINPPQVGILAIAQPQERPVAERGRTVFRHLMTVTLSADHRAVDGVTGARFLQGFKAVLESPERLML